MMITKNKILSDRYRIIKSIGEGGMANVYLAEDMILERNVALKVLRGDLSEDEVFIRRFKREALAATSLNHPNIVQIYDIGEEDDKYFIVMEYISGYTLKQLLQKRKHLTLTEVVDICKQLSLALAHAHSKGIVHRDIKPHNVIVQEDGNVKITDFGIAITMNATMLTQTNSVMGSVHYLPPEQISGDVVDARSDIYSFGILMYELILGKLPFDGDTPVNIALQHVNDEIPSVIASDSTIPQSVENVILKCCAKNPQNRYQDAMELYADLNVCLDKRDTDKFIVDPIREAESKNYMINGNKTRAVVKPPMDKKKKLILISAIVLPVLLIIAITLTFLFSTKQVTIPDLKDMTVQEATTKLESLGLEVAKEVKKEYSDTVKEGEVIGSSPRADKIVDEGTTVTLIVSKGPETIKLDDYTGKNVEEAKADLEELGFEVVIEQKKVQTEVTDPKAVTEQTPKAGEKAKIGTKVTLYTAVREYIYPDFVGTGARLEDVKAFCNASGISFSSTEVYSNTVPAGTVVTQSKSGGSTVLDGDILEVTISKGLDPAGDLDGDGLTNGQEVTYKTDPAKADTDGDSYSDKAEIDANTNPLDAADHPKKIT